MNLTLVAVSLNEQPLSQPITAVFDRRGGTLGRADHNTMALPDPQRHISRLQAEIVAHGPHYIIRNVGASNPIVVNGHNLGPGETATLGQDEQVRVGGYLLKAQLGAASAADAEVQAHRPQTWAQSGSGPAAWLPPASGAAAAPAAAGVAPSATAPWSANPDPLAGFTASGSATASSPAGNPFKDLFEPSWAPATPAASTDAAAQVPAAAKPHLEDLFPAPAGVHPKSPAVRAAPAAAAFLPDDFDAFAPPPPPRGRADGGAAETGPFGADIPALKGLPATGADPLEGLVRSRAEPSLDSQWGLKHAPGNDPLGRFLEGGAAPRADGPASDSAAPIPTDPMAIFGWAPGPAPGRPRPDTRAAANPAGQRPGTPSGHRPVHNAAADTAERDALPAIHGAYTPPRVAPVPVQTVPDLPPFPDIATGSLDEETHGASTPDKQHATTAPAAATGPDAPWPATTQDAEALWAAFCKGAGIDPVAAPQGRLQQMQDLGRMMRCTTDGLLQMIAVRANTKYELRAGVTVIQQRNNNPLKFSPDAVAALTQLVQPPVRGFLDGPAAVQDAMQDLVGHSIGTVAGLRAAVEGMLDRFAPAALEAKLSSHSVLDSVLPATRKARLWDLYVQHHSQVRDEAQEDFHTLFGRAFVAAYEQQVQRLKTNAAKS